MVRILPLTLDVVLLACCVSGLRRAGSFSLCVERIPNVWVRWALIQFLCLGDFSVEVALDLLRKYGRGWVRWRGGALPAPAASGGGDSVSGEEAAVAGCAVVEERPALESPTPSEGMRTSTELAPLVRRPSPVQTASYAPAYGRPSAMSSSRRSSASRLP